MSSHHNVPKEIDLVYTWVNGNDPAWRAKRNAAIGDTVGDSALNCAGRYADNDELKYSLRAVELYAPWIRKIFIVTDRQIPAWLDVSNPKVHIVDHSDILPSECLPTFNSTVIEHALFKIPGLAEHFLYANDDMFFNRPVKPSDFFDRHGRQIIRFNRRPFRRFTLWLKQTVLRKPLSNYNRTIQTAANLVKEEYGVYIGHKTHHNIDAYRKTAYRHAYEIFKEKIDVTLRNKMRSDNDIQRNLYSYVPIAEKKCRPRFVSNRTSFKFHIDNHRHYAKLKRLRPMLFCLNDSQYCTDEDRRLVKEFLQKRFPAKSQFEK